LAFSRSHAPDAEYGESSLIGALDAGDADLFHSRHDPSTWRVHVLIYIAGLKAFPQILKKRFKFKLLWNPA
jgi:hypothetical protein